MQTPARLAVLFTTLVTAAVLIAGCSSSGSKSNEPLPDAAALLKDSQQTTRGQQSVHLELTTSGEVKGLPIPKLSGDLSNAPAVAAQGKADLDVFGQRFSDVGFVIVDGDIYAALTPNAWVDYGPAANVYDVSAILDPDKGLANVLGSYSDAKSESRETVDGVDTVKVTGKVTADAVNKLAPSIQAADTVPATAWVRPDGNHELVQAKLDVSKDSSVQMTLSKWGEPVTVTKPAL